MKKTFKILFAASFFLGLVLIAFLFFIFNKYSENLPSHEQLKNYNPMVTTRLYTADGTLLSEFSKENRIFVPIEAIPKNLINAFLAAEDSNFYQHHGIDPIAILRTAVRNVLSKINGKHQSMGGASTITQQVVKNFLLTNERTLQRKVREAILAFRMSQTFSKDDVLELYLNQIYLGSSAYGVAAAAQAYFNKSIDNLTIEEVALLATLPKAPSKLDPRKNLIKAKFRRDWVIGRMLKEGFISEDESKLAMEQPITLSLKDSGGGTKADFFSDSVKKELTNLYGSDDVFENGIVVSSTLNPDLQRIASAAFEKGIESYDVRHGYRGAIAKIDISEDWSKTLKEVTIKKLHKSSWQKSVILSFSKNNAEIGLENGEVGLINFDSAKWAKKYINVNKQGKTPKKITQIFKIGDVVMVEKNNEDNTYLLRQIPNVNGAFLAMDPHTGRVLAMMGGYIDAPNQFNRATQAMRQPGSIMKTFGYIAALENGMTPASIIMDEEVSLDQGEGLPPYEPANYSNIFYGPTTLRKGFERSRNVTTVRMADQVGLELVMDVVKKFKINDNPKKIYSLVLGSTETTVLRLATAYSMMVNGGKKVTPAMIEKIQDRNGTTIYRRDKRECKNCNIINDENPDEKNIQALKIPFLDESKDQITDSATAYQITSMLEGVVQNGTGARARAVGKIIGGKTGTTNNSFDSWFAGFSPDLVAVAYVGFDQPKTLGSRETGASVALPIFVDFMKKALSETPSTPFRVPNTVKFVKIDRRSGKLPTPMTPKEHIFFEAFKLSDSVESADSENGDSDFNDNADSDPSGIY